MSRCEATARKIRIVVWVALALAATGGGAASAAPSHPDGSPPTVTVGGNPIGVAVDNATHTVYVANNADNTVSVLNAATCNATHTAGCTQHPRTVKVGAAPIGDAVDQKTDTVYVVNTGDSSVSVIDGKTCNARVTSGCGKVQTIHVGGGPNVDAVDEKTDTIYVANNADNTVSAIDGATCNGTVTSGCGNTPPVVHVGSGPQGLGVDTKTDTVYDANGNGNVGTVSVIDGATCNATVTSGCGQIPATVKLTGPSDGVTVDDAAHTAYVLAGNGSPLGSIAMIDTATCDAVDHSGCGGTPATVRVGSGSIWIVEDPATRTVFVANQEDSDVSALNAATCNVHDRSSCKRLLPAMAAGFSAGAVDVDIATDTLYYSSQNNGTVSVLNGATCNGTHTSGCTRFAATTTVGTGPQPIVVDQSTHTVYVGNTGDDTVSVVNAAACATSHTGLCDRKWPTIKVGSSPFFGLALNHRTKTLYVTNVNDNTVSVVNAATCDADVTSGCGQSPPTIAVGKTPGGVAIDERTDTIYVANIGDNTVSVINGAICNAHVTSGCHQTPPTVKAGNGPLPLALDRATHTLYVGDQGNNTVSVINAATCNAQNTSGCTQTPPTVKINDSPYGLAVDQRTNTVYVANTGNEIFDTGYANRTSTISIINTAACNATHTSGCSLPPRSVAVGGFPWDVAVDPATNAVYITSIADSTVAVLNGATCNGHVASHCHPSVIPARTGGWPADIGLDPASQTMYVTNNVDGTISLFQLGRR